MAGSIPLMIEYSLLTAWILIFIIRYRSKITCMVGMMGAMCLAMTVGFGTGTLFAALFPGHFFQACMISMLLAGCIGAAAGLPVSIMAVLDGLLAGIMGGMMGAMLTTMIAGAYITPTLKIAGILTASIIFMLLIMLLGEVKDLGTKRSLRLLFLPQTMFAFDILLFVALFFSHPLPPHIDNQNHNHNHEMPSSSNYMKEMKVTATDFAFSPQNITMKAHENVKVTLINAGKVEHDLEIKGVNVHIHAMPGSTASDVIHMDKPGVYKAVCTHPGHKEAGMVLTITIIP